MKAKTLIHGLLLCGLMAAISLSALGSASTPVDRFDYSCWWAAPGYWQRRIDLKLHDIRQAKRPFDLVMVGDSITHNWEGWVDETSRENLLRHIASGRISRAEAHVEPMKNWTLLTNEFSVLNLGISGDDTRNVLWRLTDGRQLDGYKARFFAVMIGTNNASDAPDDVAKAIGKIVALIRERHPESTVLLHPIFPRGERPDDPRRRKNESVNALIRGLADGDHVVWCDFNARLTGADGVLSREMMSDLLHPCECGYAIWREELVRHLVQRVEVYAHSFAAGGWKLDSQFMDVMGSPYLLAHGMGRPVPDATATVDLPEAGTWRVRARTRNWAPGAPGKFQILVDGRPLAKTFGEGREVWSWENGGEVTVADRQVRVTLRDLTGFDGRCAGVVFERGGDPEEDLGAISVTKDPKLAQTPAMTYDLVVVGGGVPGCCAALAAARRGLRVALVQDRPVLGGNSSSEIRVWSAGELRYPIVKEMRSLFMNRSKDMWISDEDRLARLQREPNLSIFLSHRAFAVEKKGDRIAKVFALDFVNGRNVAFAADNFVDATGDGWIGFFAGADYSYGREGRNVYNEPSAPEVGDRTTLGASIMWESCEDRHGLSSVPIPFSAPWAEPFAEGIAAIQGRWNWEYGLNRDMISEGEAIRDRLFLAIYGAFSLAKKNPENNRRILVTMPFLIGKRESRRLLGDHVLVEQDVTSRRPFEDAVATGSWSIDLHYTITNATFLTRCEQPHYGRYWIPYRSLYSRNVPNLFLTGRCASYSHIGLGSPRVINTLAQTGVAVGEAAALCKKYGAVPREIWTKGHTRELQDLLGGAWPGRPDPRYASWRIVDDESEGVVFVGAWNERHNPNGGQIGNISHSRRAPKRGDVVRYPLPVEKAGRYRVYRNVPFDPWHLLNLNITHQAVIESGGRTSRTTYDLWTDPGEWVEIGVFDLEPGATLTVDPAGAEMACADGFAIVPL